MTPFQALEKLREKPESVKHHIALGTSIALTLVVAVIWLSTLSLGPVTDTDKLAEIKATSPWENMKIEWAHMRAAVNGSFEYNNTNQ